MIIGKKMQEALNEQINAEMFSFYIYLAMAAWLTEQNLSGFGHWMEKQANEEMAHAMRIFKYIQERGGQITLKEIPAPQKEWASVQAVFEEAYSHEQVITNKIHDLVKMARSENDLPTEAMLQWFVNEQVEEEDNTSSVLEKMKMLGESKGALLQYDAVMGRRD